MRFFTLFISIWIISSITTISIGNAECAIDRGPRPLLAAYLREVATEVGQIRSSASSANQCRGTDGTFSNENRFFSLLNRIDAQVEVSPNVFDDFQYSIILTAEGEARGPVTAHGKLIRNLESATLIPSLKSVASACALDVRMTSGETHEQALSRIITTNRALEVYYRAITLGNTRQSDGLTPKMKALYDEIRKYYNPHATASCKADVGVDNMEDLMKRIMNRIGQMGKKTEGTQNNWEEAIALFEGKGAQTQKYKDLQMRLLSAELTRQGLSKKARDAMLGNLTCFQQKTTPTSTPEEMGKARAECTSSLVTGLENLTNWYKPLIFQATNTDQFMSRLIRYDKEKKRLANDMAKFWEKIEKTKNADEALNEKMVTDLVNIHARLVVTNGILEKKIPEMQANCMKAQPDIVGGCR